MYFISYSSIAIWKGGGPIQNLIKNGFQNSPVCAIKMIEELDAGPIYSKINISLKGSLRQIFQRINSAINKLILEIVFKNLEPKEQKGDIYVFKRLSEEDNEVTSNLKLEEIYDKIRMLDHPSYPNAYIKLGNFKIELSNAKLKNSLLTVKGCIKK